jgi:hypothetical protein
MKVHTGARLHCGPPQGANRSQGVVGFDASLQHGQSITSRTRLRGSQRGVNWPGFGMPSDSLGATCSAPCNTPSRNPLAHFVFREPTRLSGRGRGPVRHAHRLRAKACPADAEMVAANPTSSGVPEALHTGCPTLPWGGSQRCFSAGSEVVRRARTKPRKLVPRGTPNPQQVPRSAILSRTWRAS